MPEDTKRGADTRAGVGFGARSGARSGVKAKAKVEAEATPGGHGASPQDLLDEEQAAAKTAKRSTKRRKLKSGGTNIPGVTGYQAVQVAAKEAPGDSGDDDGAIPDDTSGKNYFPEGARVLAADAPVPAQEFKGDPDADDDEDDEPRRGSSRKDSADDDEK